jgi:hypothetical protein
MRKTRAFPAFVLLLSIPLALLAFQNWLLSFHWQESAPIHHHQKHHAPSSWRAPPPSRLRLPRNASSYAPRTLTDITDSSREGTCPNDLQWRRDRTGGQSTTSSSSSTYKIPRIVHQTAAVRCLTEKVSKLTATWELDGWEYYFHDDAAIERLFTQEAVHFPLLPLISEHCLLHGTLKADLWRYLVLWVYGGVYTDLDTAPHAWKADDSIRPADEAFFVVEQFHMLSQYFMAATPRHPLMWYAIQHALQNLWDMPDTGKAAASMLTGPHALHWAYMNFRRDAGAIIDPAGTGFKPVWAGRFLGSQNYSVTVVGVGENENEYVHRDLLGIHEKRASYQQMHMRHFQDDKKHPTGRSCLSTILQRNYDQSAQ